MIIEDQAKQLIETMETQAEESNTPKTDQWLINGLKTEIQNIEDSRKLLFKQQQPETIANTINPSIKEIERFLLFLNKRFDLGLSFDNLTILISQAHHNTMGYFTPNGFQNTTQTLNGIVLNSIYLKEHPYETIAHELAHYYNNQKGIKDCSRQQYHNKFFKKTAELLLLECDARSNKGYAFTRETPAFLKMLEDEFKPDPQAFHINQIHNPKKPKTPSRLYKWTCSCFDPFIIRCGDRTLKATCSICESEFKLSGDLSGDNEQ